MSSSRVSLPARRHFSCPVTLWTRAHWTRGLLDTEPTRPRTWQLPDSQCNYPRFGNMLPQLQKGPPLVERHAKPQARKAEVQPCELHKPQHFTVIHRLIHTCVITLV